MSDLDLLRRYAKERSENAFQELVQRRIGLVYSAALRQVGGDAHLAKDVTQTVFTTLAKQAHKLTWHPMLIGWLYTSTRNVAANYMRTERRRQRWETEASRVQPSSASDATRWEELAPVLDAAMHELRTDDRDAILQRYFENATLAEVGARFGISEDAIRKRIDRALEKLRAALERRGVTSSGSALAALISHGASSTILPPNLASAVAGAAIAAGAGQVALNAGVSVLLAGKAGLIAAAAVAVSVGAVLYLSGQNERPADAASGMASASLPRPPIENSAAAVSDDYDVSDIKVLAAALIARPPRRERFTEVLNLLGRSRRTNELFRELGRQDFPSALRLAEWTSNVGNAKTRAVWGYAEVKPDEALEWAVTHPQKAGNSTIANMFLQSWAGATFGLHRDKLYAFIDRFPPKQPILSPRHDAISGIEYRANMVRSFKEIFDDPRAPSLILSLKNDPAVIGELSDGRLLALASAWARENPSEMLSYAARVTDPLLRRPLLDAAVGPYIDLNVDEALRWAISVDPDGSMKIVDRGISQWIGRSGDPEAALRWVHADDARKPHVDRVTAIVATRLGPKNYQRGYAIAGAILTESVRQKALADIALYWRRDETHFDFVKRSGNPELINALLTHTAAKNPAHTAQLLELMPAGPLRNAAEARVRQLNATGR